MNRFLLLAVAIGFVFVALVIPIGCALGQDAAATSRPASRSNLHRISIKISWEEAVLAEANEGIASLEELPKLVATLGNRVDQKVEKASPYRFPFAVAVSIDVAPAFPLTWLRAAIFDLESAVHFAEVGQNEFLETDVAVVLSVDGMLPRTSVQPFKAIGYVRRREGSVLEKTVVAGVELRDAVNDHDESLVILGVAEVERRWDLKPWRSLGSSRAVDSRPSSILAEMSPSPTAADLAGALTRARQGGVGTARRRPLPVVARVREVRGSEIVVNSSGASAGTRAYVVTEPGFVYVGMIELTEPSDTALWKIIERSSSAGAPGFAEKQMVIFQPD